MSSHKDSLLEGKKNCTENDLPVWELWAWEPSPGTRNMLEKCSWHLWSTAEVARNWSHPDISPINAKAWNCNGNLSSEIVETVWENKNGAERTENFIIWWWLQVKIEINHIYLLLKVMVSYTLLCLCDIKKAEFLSTMKLLSLRSSYAVCTFPLLTGWILHMNFLWDLGPSLGTPGWLQTVPQIIFQVRVYLFSCWSCSGPTPGVVSVCPPTFGMIRSPSEISWSSLWDGLSPSEI